MSQHDKRDTTRSGSFLKRRQAKVWHQLPASDQCVIIIRAMCEPLTPETRSVPKCLSCTCITDTWGANRAALPGEYCLLQVTTRFAPVFCFGLDADNDVHEDGAPETELTSV